MSRELRWRPGRKGLVRHDVELHEAMAGFRGRMQPAVLIGMHTTSVRIDAQTHLQLELIADALHLSLGDTIRLAVRRLHQSALGSDLAAAFYWQEAQWLDADRGWCHRLGLRELAALRSAFCWRLRDRCRPA